MCRGFLLLILASCAVAQNQVGVTSIVPADTTTGVPLNASVLVTLAYPASYIQTPIKLTKAGAQIAGSTQITFPWVRFTPDKPLDPNTVYKVEVDFPTTYPPFLSSFTTGSATDTSPLNFVSSDPATGTDGVNATGPVKLRFSRPLNPLSFEKAPFTLRDLTATYAQTTNGGYAALGGPQLQPDGVTLAFGAGYEGRGLQLGHAYQLEFAPAGLTDWLGNPLDQVPAPIVLTTFRNPPNSGPVLSGSAPADGETGVGINSSIVLVFDGPLAQIPYDRGITLDAGGPLNFTVDHTFRGDRVLVIQPTRLLPPNTQVTLRVTGLVDGFGRSLPAPLTVSFRTEAVPETRPLQYSSVPPPILPQNAAIRITYNRPVDPLLLGLGSVSVFPAEVYSAYNSTPYQLSDDHRTLTISPGTPLPAGAYSANISIPLDRYAKQSAVFGNTLSFTITGDIDTTAPQVTAVTPPDGMGDAPPASVVQVSFSKVVIPVTASTIPFLLTKDGNPVPGAFSLNGTLGTFAPRGGLDPASAYQIQIAGLTDAASNPLAPFTSSFNTASANPSGDRFQLTSISPAANATGADPAAPIVMTFNRPVNPVSVLVQNSFRLYQSFPAPVSGTFQTAGATVTFTPSIQLRRGKYFLNATFTDLTGASATANIAFQTSPLPADPTPPAVISVSPGDGQTVSYRDAYVVFTFSKPVDPATITDANLRAFSSNGNLGVKAASIAANQVSVTFNADPGTLATLYVNPGVTDLDGNPAVPFRTTVRMSDALPPQYQTGPYVIARRPGPYDTVLPANGRISLAFSVPMDRLSVEQGLLVSANGALVSGSVLWTPDSTGFTFTPASPLPYSATVNLAIVSPARDALGNPVSYSENYYGLKVVDAPPPPSPTLAVVGSNLAIRPFSIPVDAVIELLFDRAVPSALVRAETGVLRAADRQFNSPIGPLIPCTVTLVGGRMLRYRPAAPLLPDATYQFAFDSGTGSKWSQFFLTSASITPASLSVIAAGPSGPNIPLNARINVAFSNPASTFPNPPGVTLQAGGAFVPGSYAWSAGNRSLTLTPQGWLLPNTDYTVNVAGIEDFAGHTIPDRTWTFRTSDKFDFQLPTVLRVDPSGDAVSPNASISVTFSKPVAADWIDAFKVVDLGLNFTGYQPPQGSPISGSLRFSDDQRSLFFMPDRPMSANHTVSIAIPRIDDFAGNFDTNMVPYATATYSFRIALVASGAPAVTASTPDDGSAGVPLNVKIQARFDQGVVGGSLDGVTLLENGSPVSAVVKVEADGRTVTATPDRLPAAGSNYTFLVAGVSNTEGVAMTGTYRTTFAIGSTVDNTAPTFRSSPASGQVEVPLTAPIRIRFNKPINKLTATPRNLIVTRQSGAAIDTSIGIQDGGRTIVLVPTVLLAPDTQHQLVLNGIADLAGNVVNPNGVNGTFFSTSSGLPGTPVALLALDPPDGSQGIPPNVRPRVLFNQPLDLTLGDGSVQLSSANGAVPGSIATNGGSIVFTPDHSLADGVYQIQLSGLADAAGNVVPPVSSTFTVAAGGVDTTPLHFVSSTPANGSAGVPVSSTIALNFNKPVSSVSAAQLTFFWDGGAIPGSIQTQGSTVIFTPSGSLPGAASIRIGYSGTQVSDLVGNQTYVFLQFTTGANPDTTPPVLSFSWPTDGTRVPAGYFAVVLRFSKPVASSTGPGAIQIFAGGTAVTNNNPAFAAGEDGRTFTGNFNIGPDTDVTVSITSDLKDFSGNAIQPTTIHFRTLSDTDSRAPGVVSISPAAGAVNVDPGAPIEIRFGRPMVAGSVGTSLQVAAARAIATGALTHDDVGQTFDFRPDLPWPAGAAVDVALDSTAYDASGARINGLYSYFTVAMAPSATSSAISFSASANAIDVRFAGPVPSASMRASYLHSEGKLLPSRSELAGLDQLRVVPETPLEPGVMYHLVLDADQEITMRVPEPIADVPAVTSVSSDSRGFRVHFSGAINPLTLYRGGTRLLREDGTSVAFSTAVASSLDEVILVPAEWVAPLTIVLDGVESRSGARVPRQVHRP